MSDIVIVGGGIVGAACARRLADEGAEVTVVEDRIIGGGATAAGMGHLVALEDPLSAYSLELWHRLAPQLPAEAAFTPCGTLWISERELPDNPLAERLDSRQVRELEPNLRPGLAGGLLTRRDAVVYAPVAARWLLRGIRVVPPPVPPARKIIYACGARITEVFPELPVRPRKGHLAITDRYPDFARHQIVDLGYMASAQGDAEESVAFNVQPRPGGQLLIGSSRQYGATHPEVDPHMLRQVLERAFYFMPALRDCNVIRTWTGFRAATQDKQPLIGEYLDNVYLATGHEGLGVTTSLGTAELLVALVMGRTPPLPAAPYHPRRFDG